MEMWSVQCWTSTTNGCVALKAQTQQNTEMHYPCQKFNSLSWSLQPDITPACLLQPTSTSHSILSSIRKYFFEYQIYSLDLWKQFTTHEYRIPTANPTGPRKIPPTVVVVAAMQPPLSDSLTVTRTCLFSVSWDTTLRISLEFIGILEL
jgi:hypothetical protein